MTADTGQIASQKERMWILALSLGSVAALTFGWFAWRLAEGAPEGFGVVFDAFRKSLEAQIAAMDNMNKVGAQIQGITDSNLLAIKRVVETGAAAPVAAKRKAA